MQKFPWKRFWCPPEGVLRLDDNGYLSDPEDQYAAYFSSDVRSYEEIRDIRCLILLGEPGIGKSQTIEDEILNLRRDLDGTNDHLIALNLKDFNSEDRLWASLFESEGWSKFRQADHRLHLYLDSLDEVRIRIHNVQNTILRGLRESPVERLFLRIVCRTSEWPSTFLNELSKLWSEAQIKTFEIVPLRYKDVEEAARLKGLNGQAFMDTVSMKNIGPLAARPITLNLLLSLFEKEGQLPTSTIEIYERGCLQLCTEPDEERQEKEDINRLYVGFLTPQQRIVVASHIAAILILSNNIGFSKGKSLYSAPEGYLPLRVLTGKDGRFGQSELTINEDAIRDTLKTGLFTSRGNNLLGFAHPIYADFLATRYLEHTPVEQIRTLMTHPHNRSKIIPQLYEIAAWLASRRFDVMNWILHNEPEILLRSDIMNIGDEVKEQIVASLLGGFTNERLFYSGTLYENYYKLAHPTIAEQLRPFLIDKNATMFARRAAIDMAETCKVKVLEESLANIALDTTEDYHLRVVAADAFSEVAGDEIKKKFEPLAKGTYGDDPDDELKAAGLACMWPKYWDIVELIRNITPRKNKHLIGSYSRFLHYEVIQRLPEEISAEDLSSVLATMIGWIDDDNDNMLHEAGKIYDKIIGLSWKAIPSQQVMKHLSEIALKCSGRYKRLYGQDDANSWTELSADIEKKHELIKYMINEGNISDRDATLLVWGETRLVDNNDFPWLLKEIEGALPLKQPLWTQLIMSTLHYGLPVDWMSNFLEVRQRVPSLEKAYLVYWTLDSELSRKSKANYLMRMRAEERNRKKPLTPSISARIDAAIEVIESDKTDEWFKLAHYLWFDPETATHQDWGLDIKKSPGWKAADEQLQKRIRQAACKFVLNYVPDNDEWFGKGSWTQDMLYICTALVLVSDEPNVIDSMQYDDWGKWIPYCVDNPVFLGDDIPHCKLFILAYNKRPDLTKEYLGRLVNGGSVSCLRHLEKCWNDELTRLTLSICESETIKPDDFREIANHLAALGVTEIEETVADKFMSIRKTDADYRVWLGQLGVLLLTFWSNKYWPLLWDLFQKDQDIAEEILAGTDMATRHNASFIESLSEPSVADLYRFMFRKFPPEEDIPLDGGAMTSRQMLADLRNTIFNKLVGRGTKEACKAIKSLAKDFPDQRSWMTWRLREAESITLRKSWISLKPSEIIDLLGDPRKRYVETDEDLLLLVMESLERFQAYYKYLPMPAVARLWNYQGSGNRQKNFAPKDEEDLSEEIARWIRDDLGPAKGVIVNREVQPRRGQKTDIYVNATAQDVASPISNVLTVVVEVKGCWNRELLSSMRTQLADRYMKDNSLSCGLYVVGWYSCDKWDGIVDKRKKDVYRKTLAELETFLNNLASEIKRNGANVAEIRSLVLNLTL